MENREMIMRCAKTLFYAKGYDAVGVQKIVDKAGVTKPTLYYYFGSKQGLMETILYMLFMALFYSARENEAYQAVKPYVAEFYDMIVDVFGRAADQLGNMNGRQRQFAIGFIGTINHYLILQFEEGEENGGKIQEEEIDAVVRQFMYGIFS